MTIYHYHKTGQDKKRLVEAAAEILHSPAAYLGAPSFSYQVGGCTIDRDGTLAIPEGMADAEQQALLSHLKEHGFLPSETFVFTKSQPEESAPKEPEKEAVPKEPAEELEKEHACITRSEDTITVEIPKAGFCEQALTNLRKIVDSKATLLKLALGTDTLDIQYTEDTIRFPWFIARGIAGEADAYAKLVAAIVQMAKRQKRVTASEQPIENAKFSMRLFLIRLGFIGDEYKTARKILTARLSGNSSWKHGAPTAKPQLDPAPTESVETPSTLESDNDAEMQTESTEHSCSTLTGA